MAVKGASVYLLNAAYSYDRPYSYLLPAGTDARRGTIVAVPFGNGNRSQFGIVRDVFECEDPSGMKTALYALREPYYLPGELLDLCEHMRENLFCSVGDAAKGMLPAGLRVATDEYYVKGERFADYLRENPDSPLAEAADGERIAVDPEQAKALLRRKVLEKRTEAVSAVNEKKVRCVSLRPEPGAMEAVRALKNTKAKEKYLRAAEYLAGQTAPVQARRLEELFALSGANLDRLVKIGAAVITYEREYRTLYDEASFERKNTRLSEEQTAALEELLLVYRSDRARAALLYGVTGSGKTEVVLSLADRCVSEGGGVIFLVPEIALTGQSASLLFPRYPEKVAVLHSGMSRGQRNDAWQAILRGEKTVVLGTRSAIFAPVKNLALIVLDEEQDDSYKSDLPPKYHARDIARFRCHRSGAMLLLASATPSLETFYRARAGKYRLVRLEKRYRDAPLPQTEIADVRDDFFGQPDRYIGSLLYERLWETLRNGEQAILFLNRRGYRSFLSCRGCGHVILCPNCSVSMTLHGAESGRLLCHYCGYRTPPPEACPSCGGEHLQYRGYGTEKLQEELRVLFPKARVLRMDADTTAAKHSHDGITEAFKNGRADILIGTQMVAKGHNFPGVTLVGVIMADLSLYLSDYRAGETTFSLLTQVIGRAGRSQKEGCAVIQTCNPYHEVLQLCPRQDYETFYESEIRLRQTFLYPPFCRIALVLLSGREENRVGDGAVLLDEYFRECLTGAFQDVKMVVYGPHDASVYKVKNIYRKKMVIKYTNTRRAREFFSSLLTKLPRRLGSGLTVSVDINPGIL